jgi:DNA-binding MarR family transcriptional regulator
MPGPAEHRFWPTREWPDGVSPNPGSTDARCLPLLTTYGVRDVARQLKLAAATVSEAGNRLAKAGLLTKLDPEDRARTSASYVATPRGWWALRALGAALGGSAPRSAVRGARLAFNADLLEPWNRLRLLRPHQEELVRHAGRRDWLDWQPLDTYERLQLLTRADGSPLFTRKRDRPTVLYGTLHLGSDAGLAYVQVHQESLSITLRTDIVDSPYNVIERAGWRCKAALGVLERLGVYTTPPTWQQLPEFAIPGHPAAVDLSEGRSGIVTVVEGLLWADRSHGPELETNCPSLAQVMSWHPYPRGGDPFVWGRQLAEPFMACRQKHAHACSAGQPVGSWEEFPEVTMP